MQGHCMGQAVGIKQDLERDLRLFGDALLDLDNAQGTDPTALPRLLEIHKKFDVVLERLRCHNHTRYMNRVHEEEGKAGSLLHGKFVHTLGDTDYQNQNAKWLTSTLAYA
ncbi:hypothetical protein NDU88_002323 [Pleurodeles waltl]|uniref:Uncharacterized protein n=1 Tax=Pleurodeles waltl TaxID=8319 RepID=A0AAV7L0Y6_PLEWA|nr:hypothetical protein NDU88_002323 [Pleurodeles waltl]